MKKSLLTSLCTMLCFVLFTGTVLAKEDQGLVIDIDKTSMASIEIHVADLTKIIQPLVTDTLLKALSAGDKDTARIVAVAAGAQIKELAVSYDDDDFLVSIGLPAGDLTPLAKGQWSVESFGKAFGSSFTTHFGKEDGIEQKQLTPVAPQIFATASEQFYAVEGQILLVGSSQELIQAGLEKTRKGQTVVAVPNSGQGMWIKTNYTVFHAPTEAGPFKETQLDDEVLVFNTKDGLRYQKKANYTDVIPFLNSATPVDLKGLPFFGATDQNILVSISGSLLDALSKIKLASAGSSLSVEGMLPFALKDIKRISLVTGGAQSSVMGVDIPAFYASIDAANTVLDVLPPMVKSLNGQGWNDTQSAGWDSMATVDNLVLGDFPLPAQGFIAKRGEQLVLGSAKKEALVLAQGMPEMLKSFPDNIEYSMLMSLDLKSLWNRVGETLKPGSVARSLSGIDSSMNEREALAFKELLATPFPVKQIIQWSSPNLNETRGIILLEDNVRPFIDAFCTYILASAGDTTPDPAQQGEQDSGSKTPSSEKGKDEAGSTEGNLFEHYKKLAPTN